MSIVDPWALDNQVLTIETIDEGSFVNSDFYNWHLDKNPYTTPYTEIAGEIQLKFRFEEELSLSILPESKNRSINQLTEEDFQRAIDILKKADENPPSYIITTNSSFAPPESTLIYYVQNEKGEWFPVEKVEK